MEIGDLQEEGNREIVPQFEPRRETPKIEPEKVPEREKEDA